ncbi:hypothetical protein BDQ17DRAFT_1345181 [Cyathus striatus]|nr:hypothetical protein BDQ17DRAFT_1345181 [Cyathus striatus]
MTYLLSPLPDLTLILSTAAHQLALPRPPPVLHHPPRTPTSHLRPANVQLTVRPSGQPPRRFKLLKPYNMLIFVLVRSVRERTPSGSYATAVKSWSR